MTAQPPRTFRSNCPINYAAELLGDKWSMLVLREMLFNQGKSFSDFKKMPEGIATNILSARLEALRNDGLITKSTDPRDGRRANYALTDRGKDLAEILLRLMAWSSRHADHVEANPGLIRQIEADPRAVADAVRACL